MSLPNPLPRPAGELEALSAVWQQPRGIRILTAVNNTYIGLFYVGAALLFLVLAGILALLMRAQLAVPGNDFIGHDTYNQLFTMHGSVMMFLFAVPVVEAIAILLLPPMLGARVRRIPTMISMAPAIADISMNPMPSSQKSARSPGENCQLVSGGYMNQPPTGATPKNSVPKNTSPPIR